MDSFNKSETGMENSKNNAFDFMNTKTDLLQWEATQEELDRQWYDAEEEGNIRYDDPEDENQESF